MPVRRPLARAAGALALVLSGLSGACSAGSEEPSARGAAGDLEAIGPADAGLSGVIVWWDPRSHVGFVAPADGSHPVLVDPAETDALAVTPGDEVHLAEVEGFGADRAGSGLRVTSRTGERGTLVAPDPGADRGHDHGTVRWFNPDKGYGFIQRDSGDDVYVERSSIQTEGYDALTEGQRVFFAIVAGPHGREAVDVVVTNG